MRWFFFFFRSSRWWSRTNQFSFRFRVNSIHTVLHTQMVNVVETMIGEKTVVIPLQECLCDSQTKSSRVVVHSHFAIACFPLSRFDILRYRFAVLFAHLFVYLTSEKSDMTSNGIWAISGKPASAAAKKKKSSCKNRITTYHRCLDITVYDQGCVVCTRIGLERVWFMYKW